MRPLRLIRPGSGPHFLCQLTLLIVLVIAVSCTPQPSYKPTPIQQTISITSDTLTPAPIIPTPTLVTPSATSFVCNEDWQSLPVLPEMPEAACILYQQGLAQGNNARAFSKIGDGEISTYWFLTVFDLGEEYYDLGEHQDLKAIIEAFHGSFGYKSAAARRGFNTNLILDATVGDPMLCKADESPLACELRIHNPSIAILSLGTNQVHRPEEFEAGMRRILDILISKKVLPILSTKGDNLEGDQRINRTIACLAQEYQIPLWNFWAAIQPLPNHGLQPDMEHLTYFGINDFDDPVAMRSAWTIRNLTALQVLDVVWKSIQ